MNQRYLIPIVGLLLLSWGLLTIRIDAMWFGHHDENGRWISTAARNYELYGASNLDYLVTVTSYPTTEAEQERYVHHPPLIVWLVSLSSNVFGRYGESSQFVVGTPYELSARLVPIFSTMISLAAFFVIVRRLYNAQLALLALFLYIVTPMTAYFGRMVNHEPLALVFLYLFIAIFINWIRRYTHQRTAALILFASLAMWSAWAPAFFFFTLGIIALIFGKTIHRIAIVGVGIAVGIITAIIPIYYALAHEETLAKLQEAFQFRTSNQSRSRGSNPFTFGDFVLRQITHMLTAMGFGLVVLGTIGTAITVTLKNRFADAMVLAMLIGGLLYMLVFRNAFFIHDYYKIYLMPSLTIASAVAITTAFNRANKRGFKRYYRPLVVSIVIVSVVTNIWWLNTLHRSGQSLFAQLAVADINRYTQEGDIILTNLSEATPAFEYYAYRRIISSQSQQQAIDLAENSDDQIWYLLCPAFGQNVLDDYEGILADYPYEVVANDCRLTEISS